MRERSSKVSTIDRAVPRGFGRVNVFAATTIKLDGFFVRDVGETDGEARLGLTENTRTSTKVCSLVFLELLRGKGKNSITRLGMRGGSAKIIDNAPFLSTP